MPLVRCSGGRLSIIARRDSGGKSTCYLTLHPDGESLTAVHYWNAKLHTFPVLEDFSLGEPIRSCQQVRTWSLVFCVTKWSAVGLGLISHRHAHGQYIRLIILMKIKNMKPPIGRAMETMQIAHCRVESNTGCFAKSGVMHTVP